MAIQCPQVGPFYRPNAQPGDIIIFDIIDDLNIGDDNGESVFFTSSLIERGDDIDGTTFFPTATTGGGFRNAGGITNGGTTITYTVDGTMEPGDCIMIQYTATNTLNQPDSDCTQTFEVCFAAGPTQPPEMVLPCLDQQTVPAGNNQQLTAAALTSATGTIQFNSQFVVDANGNSVVVPLISNTSVLDFSSFPPGTYTITYQITDGTSLSATCTVFYTIAGNTGGTGNLSCINNVALTSTDTGLDITSSELSNDPAATITDLTFNDPAGADAGTVTLFGSTATILANSLLANTTYTIGYTLRAADGTICSGSGTYTTVPVVIDNPNFTGNNLICSQSRWLNGTPTVTCGGAASEHQAELIKADGTAWVQGEPAPDFILNGMPTGTQVSIIARSGNVFTFRIDPSNAQCSGISNGSIGI